MRVNQKRNSQGSTLIEFVIAMIIISIGLVGILNVINYVMTSAADPIIELMQIRLAESALHDTHIYLDDAGSPVLVPSTLGRHAYVTSKNMNIETVFLASPPATTNLPSGAWVKVTVVPNNPDLADPLSLTGYLVYE
jgi:prepilin-type N-terminal cleavage/methylation domain-containing protein